jgi:hypothetical protein
MRKRLMIAVLGGAMLVAPGLVPPARASHDWLAIGTAFQVGAAYISFVFAPPGYGYRPAYFYRFDRPIGYRGLRCSRYCFHEGGYYYHHASCPLAAAHFSYYGVDPYWAYDRYAPRYDGYDRYDGYGRGGYGDYDRRGYDGYYDDRGDDRDYDDRGDYGTYDRYDRRYQGYDGHRRYDDRYYRDDRYYDRGHGRGHGRGHHKHHRGCGHY